MLGMMVWFLSLLKGDDGDQCLYVEQFLHLWDEAYLVMVDDLFFNVFLDLVCKYFIEFFASMFIWQIGLKFFLC